MSWIILAIGRAPLGRIGIEADRAGCRAGRRGKAAGHHIARRIGIERGVQEIVVLLPALLGMAAGQVVYGPVAGDFDLSYADRRLLGAAGGDELGQLIDLLEADEPEPLAQLNDAERRNWVQSALAELPEQLRAAVTLVYYQGLKYREAAEVLSIPVGTVKSRMHSAILKLNEAWHSTNERR